MAGRGDIQAGRAFVSLYVNDSALVRGLMRAQQRLRNLGQSMQAVGAVSVASGAAIVGAFISPIRTASDLQEIMSKFDTVFGQNSEAVKAWGNEFAAQVGRSKQQVAEFMAGSQDLFVPLGFDDAAATELSKTITGLSIDLASFNNMQDADTLRDLHAALTGSGEVMKKYGVIVSEAAVKQELLNQSIDPKAATEQQKVMARLQIIMRGTTAAQGDAIRTGDSWANQNKRIAGSLTDVAAKIGGLLIPVLQPMQARIADVLSLAGDWIDKNKNLIIGVAKVGAVMLGFGGATMIAGYAFTTASSLIGGITSSIRLLRGGLALGGIAMKAFGTASILTSGIVTKALAAAKGAWTLQLGTMATGTTFASTLLGGIGTAVASVVAAINLPVVAAVAAVAVLGVAFWKLADPISALMPLVTEVMTAFKKIAGALLQGDFAGAFDAMADSIRPIMFAAARGVIDLWRNTFANLTALVTGGSEGMAGALSTVGSAAQRIFNEVWEAGKVAFNALALFANDVFSQAPQIIGYAFGLAMRKVVESVLKLQQWMAQVFTGFVSTLFNSFSNLGPGLIRAMLTGDISSVLAAIGPAVQKALAAQALAVSGMAAGLFGGEMPEFKMSPETIAAYEKMAAVVKPSEGEAAALDATPGATSPASAPPAAQQQPAPQVNPESLERYKARLAELSKAFDESRISADQFAAGVADIQAATFGPDETPVETYRKKLDELNEALESGKITHKQYQSAVKVAFTADIKKPVSPSTEETQEEGLLAPPAAPETPKIPKTEIGQYKERLAELSAAFANSKITAEEFATGLSALKTDALKIDATPLEQYDSRLEMLNQALADGTITQREWKSAVADARDEIFGLATSPLDDFRDRVVTLQQAVQSGAIDLQEYGKQLADAKREILGIEPSKLDQFGERVKELQEQLKAGAITKAEFDQAFKTSQQNFLGIDTDPIDKFREKLAELRAALDKGIITKDQFKTAAMDALPSRVKQIIDETRTPMEKYKTDMAELDKLKGAGLIDKDTYARKSKQLAETRDGATAASTKPTTFGSFSASALIESGRGNGASGISERMHELSKQQAKLTDEQLTELKELRKAFSKLAEGMRSV